MSWLPAFHDMGLTNGIIQPVYKGRPCYLMPAVSFLMQPIRWLQAISRYRATISGGPNFAYELCNRRTTPEQRETLDLSSWDVAYSGAEPVRADTVKRFVATFASCGFRPRAFHPCYGLAETTLMVTGGPFRDEMFRTIQVDALEQNRIVDASAQHQNGRTLVSSGRAMDDTRVADRSAGVDDGLCSGPGGRNLGIRPKRHTGVLEPTGGDRTRLPCFPERYRGRTVSAVPGI